MKFQVRGKKSVLVIDDTPSITLLISEMLKECGVDPIIANCGFTGLALAKKHIPDLIFLDQSMPGMAGTEVCEYLRAYFSTKHIPVVFLTASLYEGEEQTYFAAGANRVIGKPFLYEDICSVCNDLTGM